MNYYICASSIENANKITNNGGSLLRYGTLWIEYCAKEKII